LQLTMIKYRCA